MADYAVQRTNMVESQVRPSDMTDRRVIRAMLALPRERFVPADRQSIAYMDEQVRVAPGRALLAPRVLAKMLQAAEIGDNAVVLDVGCATGYSSAVIARFTQTVVALEQDTGLARTATETLAGLGIDNVAVVTGDLAAGVAAEGPFDAILVNGAIAEIPRGLLDQLKDGGRLIAIRSEGALSRAVVHRRRGMAFDASLAFDANGPMLPGFERRAAFVF